MTRIAVNRHIGQVWYDSFAEVVADLTSGENAYSETYNDLWAHISDIVLYNVRYRDILRRDGIEGLLATLFDEAPAFRQKTYIINSLKGAIERHGPLADYDIQCLSVQDTFSVHGQQFKGLRDVKGSIEWYMRRDREPYRAGGLRQWKGNVHILCNYDPYPIFDSSDWSDDRTYCNYFFLKRMFLPSDFKEIQGIRGDGNFCKAHERLPRVGECPLLYYPGDGESMLLVTGK